MTDQSFTYDETKPLTSNQYSKTGHYFLGWAETADGAVKYADGAPVSNLTAEQGKTLTLYAVWAPNVHTVIWYDNTGTTTLYTDTQAVYGARPVYDGDEPFAAGGIFTGWATEKEQQAGVPAGELPAVAGDAKYYAAFRPFVTDYYTVTWMDYEGAQVLAQSQEAANAKAVYPGAVDPARTRTGYTCVFNGWNAQPLQSEKQELPRVTQNAVYYAAFTDTANTYTVRFDANGGTGGMSDQSFTYDTPQALKANAFTRAHYHFLGWSETAGGAKKYGNGDTVKNLTATAGATVTLYAVWEIDTHTVTWYDEDVVLESDTVAYGSVPQYHSADPTRMGADFVGWANSPAQTSGIPAKDLPPVTKDIAYYAAFRGSYPSYYTVTWMDYEGIGVLAQTQEAYNSRAVYPGTKAPTHSVVGYESVFRGWSHLPEQAEEAELPRVTEDAAYYAAFAVTPNSYTVAFNANSASASGSMASVAATYDEALTLPKNAFSPGAHEVFQGWALTPDGAVRFADGATVFNLTAAKGATVSLYAVWAARQPFTVYFDPGCGSCATKQKTVWQGEPYGELPSPTPSTPTCVFQGWYTGRSGGVCVTAETIVALSVDQKLYARWTSSGGGNCAGSDDSGGSGGKPVSPKNDVSPVAAFSDINPREWYYEAVCWAVESGVMIGTNDEPKTFEPDGTASRATLVMMLWRLAGQPATDAAMKCSDVALNDWYYDAVRWAAATGIVLGFEDGSFRPDLAISRQDLVTLLYRAVVASGRAVAAPASLNGFADADLVAPYARDAMGWAIAVGAVDGMGDGTLSPDGTATRAQTAKILYRCREILK